MAANLFCRMCGQNQWLFGVKYSFTRHHRSISAFRKIFFVSGNHFCTDRKSTDDKTTVDKDEVAKFGRLGSRWWDLNGEMAPLHSMNRLRVPFIKKTLLEDTLPRSPAKPLQGKRVLDIGCGGGILCEPLARLGADVMGIDASPRTIHVAMWHSRQYPEIANHVTYHCTTIEDMAEQLAAPDDLFDCVVASEVIEHVSDKLTFLSASHGLIKPGGHIIITTVNRTPQSYAAAIVGAEYILRLLPPGTHDWHKFATVDELREMLMSSSLQFQSAHGMAWNPFSNTWSWSQNTCINYLVHAKKASAESTIDSDNTRGTGEQDIGNENHPNPR